MEKEIQNRPVVKITLAEPRGSRNERKYSTNQDIAKDYMLEVGPKSVSSVCSGLSNRRNYFKEDILPDSKSLSPSKRYSTLDLLHQNKDKG